ncbi:MAG: LLM class flavin-dependent oxidoreductase [Acidobacteriota bacterium]|nr:LLM class flavin-dependent oxidoreductase [Acidobacteriota bacterium]
MSERKFGDSTTNQLSKIPFSILDLSPVNEDSTAAESFRNSLLLAQHAERLGYKRFWLAEHHNMTGIASAATSVVIGYIAGGTSKIRVGAGGIMLPNHAPLVIAEQFGTLESLYPERIDLGLGRAPGSDQMTARALRRTLYTDGDDFPELLEELRFFFREPVENQKVRAVPGAGLDVPIWLLGSSGFSARLAGELSLPFGFAGHFSPEYILPALELYRKSFVPSDALEKPYAMLAINIVAAETDKEAWRLATTQFQSFLRLIRGTPGQMLPPVETMDGLWTAQEKALVDARLGGSIIGSAATVKEELARILSQTKTDELMINAMIFDHAARLRSYEIVADFWKEKTSAQKS